MPTLFLVLYILIVFGVCISILVNTETPSKALGYLLLVISFPVLGIIIYLSVGLNYRKKELYRKKLEIDNREFPKLEYRAATLSNETLLRNKEKIGDFFQLASFSRNKSFTSDNNNATLLINGEEKFPDLIESIRNAKHHIHIQYYIYENDEIGNQLAQVLIEKAKQGVEVRFIYDDFGSSRIRKNIVKQLREGGVEAYPFYKIHLILLANRMNYRNHRKIVVVDGVVGYVGGINVADNYLPLLGGTMLGDLILNSDPTIPLQAATKQYVDKKRRFKFEIILIVLVINMILEHIHVIHIILVKTVQLIYRLILLISKLLIHNHFLAVDCILNKGILHH